MIHLRHNTGLIRWVLLIIVLIIVLSYFNFDIRAIVEAPLTQSNLQYVSGWVAFIWSNYLSSPVLYFWHNIFIDLLWNSFVENLERIKRGEAHSFQINAPQVIPESN